MAVYLQTAIASATTTALNGLSPGVSTVSCGIDLSGVGYCQDPMQMGCIAVGDKTVLYANHTAPRTSFNFIKQNDTSTTYTATSLTGGSQVGSSDIQVAKLTAPLPSWVKRHKLLSIDWPNKLSNGSQALYVRQGLKLYLGDWNSVGTYTPPSVAILTGDANYPSWFFTPLIVGDSGFAAGFLIGGEFVAAMHMTNLGLSGPNYGYLAADIQATMTSLGTGDTLQYADIGGYMSLMIWNELFLYGDGNLVGNGNWAASDGNASPVVASHVLGGINGADSSAVNNTNLAGISTNSNYTITHVVSKAAGTGGTDAEQSQVWLQNTGATQVVVLTVDWASNLGVDMVDISVSDGSTLLEGQFNASWGAQHTISWSVVNGTTIVSLDGTIIFSSSAYHYTGKNSIKVLFTSDAASPKARINSMQATYVPPSTINGDVTNVIWMPGTDPRMGDLSKRARQMKMMRESRE